MDYERFTAEDIVGWFLETGLEPTQRRFFMVAGISACALGAKYAASNPETRHLWTHDDCDAAYRANQQYSLGEIYFLAGVTHGFDNMLATYEFWNAQPDFVAGREVGRKAWELLQNPIQEPGTKEPSHELSEVHS